MYTNVEKALMIATDVGMKGIILEGVALVTELAEYYRFFIQKEIIAIAFSMGTNKNIQRRGELSCLLYQVGGHRKE